MFTIHFSLFTVGGKMKNGCLRFTFLKMKKTMNPHFAFSLIMTNNK